MRQRIKTYLTLALMPPVGACRYGCASGCAAPVTVFWLFGLVSLIFALFGGPTGAKGISWATMGIGFGMWVVSVLWALWTTRRSVEKLSNVAPWSAAPSADSIDQRRTHLADAGEIRSGQSGGCAYD